VSGDGYHCLLLLHGLGRAALQRTGCRGFGKATRSDTFGLVRAMVDEAIEMIRAAEIVVLRAVGLSLSQVARVLEGDPQSLELALVAHEAALELENRKIMKRIDKARALRAALARGQAPATEELTRLLRPSAEFNVIFELPWPWGGERFEVSGIRPINYIVGPLGSGKTRLARRLAETLPGAAFLGLERLEGGGAVAAVRLDADAALKSRVDQTLDWLVDEGATVSEALCSVGCLRYTWSIAAPRRACYGSLPWAGCTAAPQLSQSLCC
jgi:hypothetical protein